MPARRIPSPRASFSSIRGRTERITTGTSSCRESQRDKSTLIARKDRSSREKGLRFDAEKVLMDPYGRAVVKPKTYTRRAATLKGGNASAAIKSVVADLSQYDWEGDLPLMRPFAKTVIYEMHVRGFTRHPSSGVAPEKRGTYAGLIEKIPYLRDLGITAVELLPVFEFDEADAVTRVDQLLGL